MPEACNINHLDHIGIAVKDIDKAVEMFTNVFGTPPCEIEQIDDQGVKATLIEVGQTRIELLEPLSPTHLSENLYRIEEKGYIISL